MNHYFLVLLSLILCVNSNAIEFSLVDYKNRKISAIDNSYLQIYWPQSTRDQRHFFSTSNYSINTALYELETKSLISEENLARVVKTKSLNKKNNDQYRISLSAYTMTFWADLDIFKFNLKEVQNSKFKLLNSTYCSKEECSDLDEIYILQFSNFNKGLNDIVVYVHLSDRESKTIVKTISLIRANNKWWKRRNPFGLGTKLLRSIVFDIVKNSKIVLEESL